MILRDEDNGRRVRLRNGIECVLKLRPAGTNYPFLVCDNESVDREGCVFRCGPENPYDVVAFVDEKEKEMTRKPWDTLRAPVETPIRAGEWRTSNVKALIDVDSVCYDAADLTITSMAFEAPDLRELAAFCNELADQFDGK